MNQGESKVQRLVFVMLNILEIQVGFVFVVVVLLVKNYNQMVLVPHLNAQYVKFVIAQLMVLVPQFNVPNSRLATLLLLVVFL